MVTGLRLEERFALGLRPEIIGPYLPQTSDLCPPNNPEPLNPEPLNLYRGTEIERSKLIRMLQKPT